MTEGATESPGYVCGAGRTSTNARLLHSNSITESVMPRIYIRRPPGPCSVSGCGRPHVARGYCSAHHKQWCRGVVEMRHPRARMANGSRLKWLRAAVAIETDACVEWPFGLNSNGYGLGVYRGRTRSAHRIAYEVVHDNIPDGLHVLHSCDNRACVNPRHLHLGTHADNMREKVERGRCSSLKGDRSPSRTRPECLLRGERHHQAKITEADAIEIRRRRGDPSAALAAEYGVSRTTICSIRRGETWAHLCPGE